MALPFQALMAEHRKDVLLESQARAVEYGQMFSYSELRPQLLEHMPPLDASCLCALCCSCREAQHCTCRTGARLSCSEKFRLPC